LGGVRTHGEDPPTETRKPGRKTGMIVWSQDLDDASKRRGGGFYPDLAAADRYREGRREDVESLDLCCCGGSRGRAGREGHREVECAIDAELEDRSRQRREVAPATLDISVV